jgi:hypothetical protein
MSTRLRYKKFSPSGCEVGMIQTLTIWLENWQQISHRLAKCLPLAEYRSTPTQGKDSYRDGLSEKA